jgi:zinc transport system substrate-binding protein
MNKSVFLLLATAIILSGCQTQTAASGKIQVAASFYPLYFFASQIGGDKAEVINITPAGTEPHDYEPTAQDIAKIEQSRLLILNGRGLEAWADNIQKNINPQKTSVVLGGMGMDQVCSIDLKLYPLPLTEKQKENICQRQADPHIWIAPFMATNIVQNILDGFVKADPANAEYYQANALILKNKLIALDSKYQNGLANCQLKTFITSHNAFNYLAQVYGLRQIAIAGLSPDAEPSSAQLIDVAKTAKAENIKYIFSESLASPKLSQTIAAEVGAQTLVLDPIEGLTKDEIAAGDNYFTVEENNLKNLQIALQCQK